MMILHTESQKNEFLQWVSDAYGADAHAFCAQRLRKIVMGSPFTLESVLGRLATDSHDAEVGCDGGGGDESFNSE